MIGQGSSSDHSIGSGVAKGRGRDQGREQCQACENEATLEPMRGQRVHGILLRSGVALTAIPSVHAMGSREIGRHLQSCRSRINPRSNIVRIWIPTFSLLITRCPSSDPSCPPARKSSASLAATAEAGTVELAYLHGARRKRQGRPTDATMRERTTRDRLWADPAHACPAAEVAA